MFVYLCVLLVTVPGQWVTHVLHFLLPPAYLLPGDLVLVGCPVELGQGPFLDLLLLEIEQPPHLVELLADLLEDEAAFWLDDALVLVHLGLGILDLLKLLVDRPEVGFVVALNAVSWGIARRHRMILMRCAPVQAVHAQQSVLVRAVQGDEIQVFQAFLG